MKWKEKYYFCCLKWVGINYSITVNHFVEKQYIIVIFIHIYYKIRVIWPLIAPKLVDQSDARTINDNHQLNHDDLDSVDFAELSFLLFNVLAQTPLEKKTFYHINMENRQICSFLYWWISTVIYDYYTN